MGLQQIRNVVLFMSWVKAQRGAKKRTEPTSSWIKGLGKCPICLWKMVEHARHQLNQQSAIFPTTPTSCTHSLAEQKRFMRTLQDNHVIHGLNMTDRKVFITKSQTKGGNRFESTNRTAHDIEDAAKVVCEAADELGTKLKALRTALKTLEKCRVPLSTGKRNR